MSNPVPASNEVDSFSIIPEGRQLRPALIGDRGIVVGILNSSASGLAQLAIRISPLEIALLCGDWRCIRDIADDLRGEEIEVVHGEGSDYGCHSVRRDKFNDQPANEQEEL